MKNTKDKDEPEMSPGLQTALFVGGTMLGLAAVGGVAYWAVNREKGSTPAAPPGPPVATPPGRAPQADPRPTPPLPFPVPSMPPVGGSTAQPDPLGSPVPPLPPAVSDPVAPEPEEPEATAEPGEDDGQRPSPILFGRGVRVFVDERRVVVENPEAWVAWAGPEVAELDVESWTADEIMRSVWRKAFPALAEGLDETWTINGQPFEAVAERGREFLAKMLAGSLVVPLNFPGHKTFAKIMAGQTYERLQLLVKPPVNRDTGWELRQRVNGFGLHHYLVRFTKESNPALGQTIITWQWWVWGPGMTRLASGNAMRKGGREKKADARREAEEFIDNYKVAVAAST